MLPPSTSFLPPVVVTPDHPLSKPRHLGGVEVILLLVLFLRAMRVLSPAMASLMLGIRRLVSLLQVVCRRIGRWRDRHWRSPRYTLRCDLATYEPGTCPVCLARLAGGDDVAEDGLVPLDGSVVQGRDRCEPLLRLRCGHTFHALCLNAWLDRQSTCPLCRADVGDVRECVQLIGLAGLLDRSSSVEVSGCSVRPLLARTVDAVVPRVNGAESAGEAGGSPVHGTQAVTVVGIGADVELAEYVPIC